ncbi:autotransporter assembly complex family protein [Silanimonas algicola]
MLLGWWLAAGLAVACGVPPVAAQEPAPLPAVDAPARVSVVDIALDGLPDEEAANARLAMTLARLSTKQRSELSEARLQFLLRRIPGEVTKALEPFGWYSPVVVVQREVTRDGVRIRVDVDPGEPVRVKTLDAGIDGAAKDDRFVMRELPKLRPAVGERFVHLDYEAGKVRVERKLADRGYFDAKRTTARVAVSRAAKRADILLRWDSGPRHAMGEARFAANPFRPGLFAPLVDWSPGEPYHRNKLDRLRARMAQLDYFALVEVVPDEDDEGGGLRVPIDITTTPAKRTAYAAAMRFGSDTGAGVRASMNRRWVNDRGHKWLSDVEWSQRRSGFTTQYRIPSLRRLPGWWGARAEYLAEDPESALGYERVGLGAGWQGRRDPFSLSGRVVYAEERTKLLRRDLFPDARQTMLYPELSATFRRVDDPMQPDDSLQVSMALRAGVIEAKSSRERFAQFEIGAQWLHTFDDAQVVVLRADAGMTTYSGAIESAAFPASLRYFAGGDRSIRGYGYREVGPRFEGETLGGLHRIVASAEYQYFFTEEWGAAVFVDAGDAFNTRSAFDPKVGVGVGARWRSPVGLVGVDVARGLDEAAGGGTRLHLSFGVGF